MSPEERSEMQEEMVSKEISKYVDNSKHTVCKKQLMKDGDGM